MVTGREQHVMLKALKAGVKLRILGALAKNPDLASSTNRMVHNHLYPSSAFLRPMQTPGRDEVHLCISMQMHTYIK